MAAYSDRRRDRLAAVMLLAVAARGVPSLYAHGVGRAPVAARVPLLRTIRLPSYPLGLVVDAPTRRLFVLAQSAPLDSRTPIHHADALDVLDARTGARLRILRLDPGLYAGDLTVDARHGHVLFLSTARTTAGLPTGPGAVHVLDGRTGLPVRTVPIGAGPRVIAVAPDLGRIFVLCSGHTTGGDAALYVLDARTGTQVRAVPIAHAVVDGPARRVFVADDAGVQVLDATSGAVRKTVALPDANAGPTGLVVDERAGRVAVGYQDRTNGTTGLAILDATTGATVGAFAPAGSDLLLADTRAGRLLGVSIPLQRDAAYPITADVFDMRRGRVVGSSPDLATVASGGLQTTAGAVDERLGRAFVVTSGTKGDGSFDQDLVSVLDTRGGRLLGRALLAVGPPAIAVDEGAARVFVINGSAQTVSVLDAARP